MIAHCHLPLAIVFFCFSSQIWFAYSLLLFNQYLLFSHLTCWSITSFVFLFVLYLVSIFLKNLMMAFIGASATSLPWSSSSCYVWCCQSLLSIRYWQMSSLLSIATDKCHPYCQSLVTKPTRFNLPWVWLLLLFISVFSITNHEILFCTSIRNEK